MSHDSPDDSGAIGQSYIGQKRDTAICCLFFCILKQALVICGNQSVDALRFTSVWPYPLTGGYEIFTFAFNFQVFHLRHLQTPPFEKIAGF